jgi:hypothetical protein
VSFSITLGGTAAVISLSISPGVTALTVSPIPLSSLPARWSANAAGDAGVVDEDVEATVPFDHFRQHAQTVFGVAAIALVNTRFVSGPLQSLAECAPRFDENPAATVAPRRTRLSAIAAPIPRVPPVTRATRPASESSSTGNPAFASLAPMI